MRWNRFARHALVLTLATGLVACGSDSSSTGPDDDEDEGLTETETQFMMEALVAAGGLFVLPSAGMDVGGPAAVTQGVDETVPCPQGGTIDLEGTLDVDEETNDIDWDATQTHNACQAQASDNSVWTFDGNPNLTLDVSAGFEEDNSISLTGTQTGGISYDNGTKSGTCSIDISYDFSGTFDGAFSGQASGTVCGVSYSFSTSG